MFGIVLFVIFLGFLGCSWCLWPSTFCCWRWDTKRIIFEFLHKKRGDFRVLRASQEQERNLFNSGIEIEGPVVHVGLDADYRRMKRIGEELQKKTKALKVESLGSATIRILDICMAPGGLTKSALRHNLGATATGITLPPINGGTSIRIPPYRSRVEYLDITMLSTMCGVKDPPKTHPHHAEFLRKRPFLGQMFQLVICGGEVLEQHLQKLPQYRLKNERSRLKMSQMILAMEFIRPGGTIIMELHSIHKWYTIEVLYHFNRFAKIQLFKSKREFQATSNFYLIAEDVKSESPKAKAALEKWKENWKVVTFGGESGTGVKVDRPSKSHVKKVLNEFGDKLIDLAGPIWKIQAAGLDDKIDDAWRKHNYAVGT